MMRYAIALMCFFTFQTVYADMTLTIIDQDNKPVSDAVILLSTTPMSTPNAVAVMDQVDASFVPRVLVIQKGQRVSFPNSDDIRHHVYSFSKPKAFEIKLYKGSNSAPVVFDKKGLVVLGCNIHDDMIGYIIVADNTYVIKTDKDGKAGLPAKQGDVVTLWSERFIEGVNATKQINITNDTEQTLSLELLPPIEIMDNSMGFGKNIW